jgi:hypothetical protein
MTEWSKGARYVVGERSSFIKQELSAIISTPVASAFIADDLYIAPNK